MKLFKCLVATSFLTIGSPVLFAQLPCLSTEEHKQLDFWLGSWRVENPQGQVIGHNLIEKEQDGCVVLEHWASQSGSTGMSMNFYDPATGSWHQTWIDNAGRPLHFNGEVKDQTMVYMGLTKDSSTGSEVIQEMTLKRLSDDSVHQLWRQSSDGGTTWIVVFDGLYLRETKK